MADIINFKKPLGMKSAPTVIKEDTEGNVEEYSVADQNYILRISAPENEEIVRLNFDKTITINPKYTVDEAAKAFWNSLMKISIDFQTLYRQEQPCFHCGTPVPHISTCFDCMEMTMKLREEIAKEEKEEN